MALLGEHLVLVVRAAATPGRKISQTPDPPSVRIGFIRPSQLLKSPTTRTDRAFGAQTANDVPVTALMHADMRAEVPPEALVPALAQQVQIQLAHRRPEAVRIVDCHHVLARIGDFQPVVGDAGAGHHPAEDAGRVQRPHRYPLAVAA